nr:MAG TPA: hypothetical protein [Caudoviricetes sp.]
MEMDRASLWYPSLSNTTPIVTETLFLVRVSFFLGEFSTTLTGVD